jgi:hypothetical protein
MPKKELPQTAEGFEHEIDFLRRLIESVAANLGSNTSLAEKLSMLETVGKAAPQLARMVKAQRELADGELDPAALLRQALDELQEEWPEFKAYCAEFEQPTGGPNEPKS